MSFDLWVLSCGIDGPSGKRTDGWGKDCPLGVSSYLVHPVYASMREDGQSMRRISPNDMLCHWVDVTLRMNLPNLKNLTHSYIAFSLVPLILVMVNHFSDSAVQAVSN